MEITRVLPRRHAADGTCRGIPRTGAIPVTDRQPGDWLAVIVDLLIPRLKVGGGGAVGEKRRVQVEVVENRIARVGGGAIGNGRQNRRPGMKRHHATEIFGGDQSPGVGAGIRIGRAEENVGAAGIDVILRQRPGVRAIITRGRREIPVVVVGVVDRSQPDLAQLAGAGDQRRLSAGFVQRRQKNANQQRDDANDNQKLNQGETGPRSPRATKRLRIR